MMLTLKRMALSNSAPISRRPGPRTSSSRLTARHAISAEFSKIREIDLVSDVILGLQGIDGHYMRLQADKSAFIFDKDRIDDSDKYLCQSILACGLLFIRVRDFCQSTTSFQGLVAKCFAAGVESELFEYYKLLSDLRAQLNSQDQNENKVVLTLVELHLLLVSWHDRMLFLDSLVCSCAALRGGALVSCLHFESKSACAHDDQQRQLMVGRLLSVVCRPFHQLLVKWVCDGLLDDSYDEFLVNCGATTSDDKLWSTRYTIRWSMVPGFLSNKQAQMILLAGKSINFLQFICKERTPVVELETNRRKLLEMEPDWMHCAQRNHEFVQLLQVTYTDISKHLLAVMRDTYNLATHFRALRQYMLLGQGDFARLLLKLLEEELDRPADQVSIHHVTSLLKTALQQSNAQFETQDVLDRIDVEPLELSDEESGWDIFMLKYWVKGPLVTVFSESAMDLYARVFTVMWHIQRLDFMLCRVWLDLATTSRRITCNIPECCQLVHSFQLVAREFLHYIQQIQCYFTFEVLESSWSDFQQRLQASTDLDEVIVAHNEYLATILNASLLTDEPGSTNIKSQMDTVFGHVWTLCEMHQKFDTRCHFELKRREQWDNLLTKRHEQGIWGAEEVEEQEQEQLAQTFVAELLKDFNSPLNVLLEQYRMSLAQLLLGLANNPSDSLRSLCVRLDFNHFYRKLEPRLGRSLTYSRVSKFHAEDAPDRAIIKSFAIRKD